MALQDHLCVSWISVLLKSSAVFSASKEGSYRLTADSKNLMGDVEDNRPTDLFFDEGELETPQSQPTGTGLPTFSLKQKRVP